MDSVPVLDSFWCPTYRCYFLLFFFLSQLFFLYYFEITFRGHFVTKNFLYFFGQKRQLFYTTNTGYLSGGNLLFFISTRKNWLPGIGTVERFYRI
jgi:hypothetical protein